MNSRSSCDAGELMSPRTADRLGLEETWRRQMRIPYGASSIVDQQIIAHVENPREYIEVVAKVPEGEEPAVLFRIPTDQIGRDGLPIGKEEAERLARREVRRLVRRIDEPTITSRIVPRIHLYTAANNGAIECRDAETGTPIWMSQVGDPRLDFGKMGIDDKFLTITNGGNLIKIDVTNGEPIKTVRTLSMPLYGVINSGGYALAPTIRNGVEGYPLSDTTRKPFMEIVSGMALEPPTKSPSSTKIAWATDRSFVYVMELSGQPSVQFRLNTDGNVSGRIASAEGDRFFFGSESGQVYGLRATRSGKVLWSHPYGEPFYKAPFLMNGMVLLPSAYGNLFAIDDKTGLSRWEAPTPNVDQILGGFDNKLFVRLLSQSFAAIDAETGKVIDVDHSMKPTQMLVNRTTDRLYFVNSSGTVQCLRTTGKELPTIRKAVDDEDPDSSAGSNTAAPAAPTDPGANPFGEVPADPFGGGAPAEPFGGGAEPAPADPFGGDAGDGNSPFGANPFGN